MTEQCSQWKDNFLLKVVNEVLFVPLLATNIYCLARGLHGHGHDVYFAVSTMTTAVWTVVQILFIATLIYQWTDNGKRVIIDGLNWRLPLIFLLNTVYLHLWIHQEWLGAFVLAIFAYAVVTNAYYIVKTEFSVQSIFDEIAVHTPISMMHAWFTYVVIEAAFEAFGERTGFEPKTWTKIYFLIGILALELAAACYAFATPEGDLVANITITWVIYGTLRRHGGFCYGVGWWGALVSLIFVAKSVLGFYRVKYAALKQQLAGGGIRLERGPLIGPED